MKIVYVEPGKKPRRILVPNDLHTLQQLVGGYIEALTFKDYVIICNEEAVIRDMEPNFFWPGNILIYGPAIFCGYDDEDFCDIPEDAAKMILEMLRLQEGDIR